MKFHHVCIWTSDYDKSIHFYVDLLGLNLYRETFSHKHHVKKLELYCEDQYVIEMFVGGSSLIRTQKMKIGFEHVSFLIENVREKLDEMKKAGVITDDPKIDENTGKEYGFCFDPDGNKIELYSL